MLGVFGYHFFFATARLFIADSHSLERNGERVKLREFIVKEASFDLADLAVIGAGVEKYLNKNNDATQLKRALKSSLIMGFRDECLAEMVHSINKGIFQGVTAKHARVICCSALGPVVKERERTKSNWNNKELGEKLRHRVKEKLEKIRR